MSCSKENCQEAVKYLYRDCIEAKFFCKIHSEEQNSNIIKALDDTELDLIKILLKEMKIDDKISKVMKTYKDFQIEFFKKLKEQIKTLKENQTEDYAFDNDAFLLKLTEAFLINKGSFLSQDKLSQIKKREADLTSTNEKLNKDLEEEKKKIDGFTEKIKELNDKFESKAKEVENKEKEIQNLNSQIKERELEIKNIDQEFKIYSSVLKQLKSSGGCGGEEIERIVKEEREKSEKEEKEKI